MGSLRRLLYQLASLLGDVNAISKGPNAIAKRIVRKTVTRKAGKLMNRLFE
jgi:hypothetical protein